MGVLEYLSGLMSGRSRDDETDPIPEEVVEAAARARGETVTPGVLANRTGRSDLPIVEYLSEDEQPEFVFQGNQLLIDNDDSYVTEYPTRDTQVVISDRRLLIVLGGHLSDDVWDVPLADVLDVYVDAESWKRYLIVEANREGEPMTFFVDVTLESATEELDAGVAFVRESGS